EMARLFGALPALGTPAPTWFWPQRPDWAGREGGGPAVNHSSRHLRTQDARIRKQPIEATKRIQIAPAEPHHPHLQQHLSFRDDRLRNRLDRCMPRFLEYERLHWMYFFPLSKLLRQHVSFSFQRHGFQRTYCSNLTRSA